MLEQIKIVRLQSGEDIIAGYIENTETEMVQLINPMTVFFKKLASGTSLLMVSPWLPVEIVENDSAMIYTSDILTVVDPKQNVIDYYQKTLLELENYKNQTDESVLDWGDDDEEDELEEYSEEDIKEALEEIKNNKKLLH
jgi:hypothetical protein